MYKGINIIIECDVFFTVPEAVGNAEFTRIGDDYIVLAWDSPEGMIDSYNVTYVPVEGGSLMYQIVNATEGGVRIDDLMEGTNYTFIIVSLLEVEEGRVEMGPPVMLYEGL